MTPLKDAVEAAWIAESKQDVWPSRKAVRSAIIAFLLHQAVREPSEAMVVSTKLRRGAVVPIWQAMLDQLVRDLRDV